MELEEREKAEKKKRGPKTGSVSYKSLSYYRKQATYLSTIKIGQLQNIFSSGECTVLIWYLSLWYNTKIVIFLLKKTVFLLFYFLTKLLNVLFAKIKQIRNYLNIQ